MNCCNDYGPCTQGENCPAQKDSDMQTRRYPRTLQEAFGPYTSTQIEEPSAPVHPADKVVLVACTLAAIALTVMCALGWVK